MFNFQHRADRAPVRLSGELTPPVARAVLSGALS